MFALWYFSLAMDELRKRIPILDRIFAFFTGKNRTVQALPESTPSDEPKPKAPEAKVSEKLTAVEPTKPTPEQKPVQPVRTPVVEPVKPVAPKPEPPKTPVSTTPETPSVPVSVNKPVPVAPAPAKPATPVEPSKVPPVLPKPSTPAVEEEVKPKDLPKPEPVATPAPAPKEPISVPTPAPAATPAPAPARLVKEKKELPSPTPKPAPAPASDAPTLPSNNEDSFIIVEQQKPATKPGQKPKVDVKNSTMDFLQGESGRGGASGATSPSSLSADR
ncbi:uncharacterized protein LOC125770582 [Anopheles funestus]|uniref:uncharacterized protein LOC125770582 n=1 Tax=Anopheles funestus TaxID=62324 RepID=UPI0020C62D6D|nr:uncharacterized protein LOC125770582 [Anopheles funestus]XP_049296271.1 uncharacterized protein LOC125770582 [Anopheles funestus]XP_049296272.1 uncharacterized protein LOC125770582 [Anopheles funestus]XP_049296273.1 uncharacterized protein LOC125770582 [Anopheles funestus]